MFTQCVTCVLQAEAAAAESRASEDVSRLRNAHATLRAEAEQQQRHMLLQLQESEEVVTELRAAVHEAAACARQQQHMWEAKIAAVEAQAQADLLAAK